ncbi:hypothetical protein ACOME3_008963 [Neoechinorhynchus agilis]
MDSDAVVDAHAYPNEIRHSDIQSIEKHPNIVYSFNARNKSSASTEHAFNATNHSEFNKSSHLNKNMLKSNPKLPRKQKDPQSSTINTYIDQFISSVTPRRGYIPSQELMFVFFLNIRRFMSIVDVLPEIVKRIFVVTTSADTDITVRTNHVMFIISYWIYSMPYDFRNPALMNDLKHLVTACLKYNPNICMDVRFAIKSLLNELRGLEKYEKDRDLENKTDKNLLNISIIDQHEDPAVLAEQLYILEVEHLEYIGPEEYIQYLGTDKKDASNAIKRTFNLDAYVSWVNRLGYFATTEIVKQLKRRKRIRVIEYFVDVIEFLIKMKNFNSALAIIGGMDHTAVRRLKKTWPLVSVSHNTRFTYYRSLLDVSNNFASYRGALAKLKQTSNSICIPFFCVELKDIHYLTEVMPDVLEGNTLNYEKMYKIAAHISELTTLSKNAHIIAKSCRRRPYILKLLRTLPIFENSVAMEASLSCEGNE